MPRTLEALGTEALPAHVAELPIWMDAVSAHIQEQRNQDSRPDSRMLALAVQAVQRTLSDGNDTSGLRSDLPEMANRAAAHPEAALFRLFTEPGDRRVPLASIQSFAIPLIKAANHRLEQSGQPSYDFLEQIAIRDRPSLPTRWLARLAMPKTRDLLFKSVLG